jgi:putative nucleotidyltransferase with HDIG domain
MSGETPILLFSDFPAEGELVEQTLREASGHAVRAVVDEDTAFATLASDAPEIVFAHLRQGAMASTYFLNEVWTRNPQTTRFLLGDSSTDSDTLVRCALGPHQFIVAPLDAEKIETALKRAEALKRFVRDEKIRLLMSRMRTLPSRPALSIEVMRELRSPTASARSVGELVGKDVAIATKLLQVANSAYYSAQQQVTDPTEAVLRLGLESTAALVLSIEAFAKLDKLKPLYFSMDRVWKHSQAVAELARKIAQIMGCDGETIAHISTSGLLHDIGKLALAQNFQEDYERLLRESEEQKVPLHQLEKDFFGVTHAEAGAYLIALWGLPLQIVEAVAYHHLSAAALNPEFSGAAALRLADQLVHTPENLKQILAEYPCELGLWPRLDRFAAVLPKIKVREQSAVNPIYPLLDENGLNTTVPSATKVESTAPRDLPKTSKKPQARRSTLYIALAAIIALAAVAGFFFWPQPAPLAQARPKPVVKRLPSDEVKETAEPAKAGSEENTEQPLPTEETFALEQLFPPDLPLAPEDETTASSEPESDIAAQLPGGLKLQAIMYSGAKSGLIINGNLLHLGESINGWEIVSIREHEVVIQNGEEQRTLTIK